MKIAIFTDTFIPDGNGAVTSICNNVRHFVSEGNKVWLFAPGRSNKEEEYYGTKVYRIKGKRSGISPKGFKKADFAFKKLNKIWEEIGGFDIVHVHSPGVVGGLGLFLSKAHKIPAVNTYHTNIDLGWDFIMGGTYLKSFKGPVKRFVRKFHNSSNILISPSKKIMDQLKKDGYKHIVVVPNSVNTKVFYPGGETRLKKELSIPRNSKVVLYVGRLSPEKRIDMLIKSFSYIRKKDFYLVIAGKGPVLNKLKTLAKNYELKNIRFTGYVPEKELPRYYRMCDVFASASDFETQGITFLEAMASGKPIVGVDAGGVHDLIINGENGFIVKPGDWESFALSLNKILSSKRLIKKMSGKSFLLSKNFSVENVSNQILNIYSKLSKKPITKKHPLIRFFEILFHIFFDIKRLVYLTPAEVKLFLAIVLVIVIWTFLSNISVTVSGSVALNPEVSAEVLSGYAKKFTP